MAERDHEAALTGIRDVLIADLSDALVELDGWRSNVCSWPIAAEQCVAYRERVRERLRAIRALDALRRERDLLRAIWTRCDGAYAVNMAGEAELRRAVRALAAFDAGRGR